MMSASIFVKRFDEKGGLLLYENVVFRREPKVCQGVNELKPSFLNTV